MGRYDHHRTRKLIRRLANEIGVLIMTNADRIDAALTGVAGDVAGLKAAYAALVEAQAAGVAEAVATAKAEFEASLDALAAKAEALDAATPPVEEPPAEPSVPVPAPEG